MRKIKIIFFDIDGTLLRLQAKKLTEMRKADRCSSGCNAELNSACF